MKGVGFSTFEVVDLPDLDLTAADFRRAAAPRPEHCGRAHAWRRPEVGRRRCRMSTVMISCGEASGDLYAGALAAELLRRDPSCRISGFGGERLRAAGAALTGDYRGFAVTGLTEAIRVLPRSYGMYRRLVSHARAERPDVFVAIDFPDFNFRLGGRRPRAGHTGRVLRQPAALGLAVGPDPRDEAVRREGAADLPVRGGRSTSARASRWSSSVTRWST